MIQDYGQLTREQQEAAVAADVALAQEIRRRTAIASLYGESAITLAVSRLRKAQPCMELQRTKPHLCRVLKPLAPDIWIWLWCCDGAGFSMLGFTPRDAYTEWRRNL